MEFKVGDRVRLIAGTTTDYFTDRSRKADRERTIGTISRIDFSSTPLVRIDFDGLGHRGYQMHRVTDLELAKRERKLKSWILK